MRCAWCILKGVKDVSWKGAKAMMTDTGFLRSLVEFEKDSLTDKQVKQVKAVLPRPTSRPTRSRDISTGGAGLLKWVYAIVNYYGVAKTVNPKRQAVAQGEKIAARGAEGPRQDQGGGQQLWRRSCSKLNEKFDQGSAEEKDSGREGGARWRASSPPRRS